MLSPIELIVRFRRRDVLMVLPFTIVAAAGSAVWLPQAWVFAWLAINLMFVAGGQLFYAGLLRTKEPRLPPPAVLAVSTFVTTAIYALLPVALLIQGSHGAAIAALAMFAAVALSSTSEFVLSTLVGAGSLSALFLSTLVAITVSTRADSPWSLAIALTANACFFAYLVGHALDRQKVERALGDARRAAEANALEAQAATAAKSDFLATMSHEIRTPLNGVLGMAQAMAAEALPETQRERLAVVRRSGETLLTILNDILDLSKIEAGKLELEEVDFDIAEVASATVAGFGAVATGKGVALDLRVADAAAGVYRSDPTRVRQILSNLISNALKFTEQGGVQVVVDRVGEVVEMRVRDTGIGIPPDRLDRLFKKFAQADASTTRKYGGTGLGLSICRELTEIIGGDIRAESTVGEGTTFIVRLLIARVGDALALEAEEAAPRDWDAGALRILAAEDNSVNQLVLKTLLSQVGIDPMVVSDGAEAVEAWREHDWDLILMDVQMPVMDGPTATRAIRELERAKGRARTPIIALTANAMAHQIAEYRAAGMDGFVSKPIDIEKLFAAIEAGLDEAGDATDAEAVA